MSLHLLPALSLGARLDEIERTARELFGSAVTISAETETPCTRSDEEPKPDKAIKVVIKIELPGAFPKLVSEQACPGGRASPAMEIGEPSSRASSSEGACAASSALGPTPFPATTTSSGAPSVSFSREQRDVAIPLPGVTRLRVRCDREYVVNQIRLAFMKCEGWRAVRTETLPSLAEAAATAAIELLGQDAGTQRAPVKLPDAPPVGWLHSRSWETCLDKVRKALAEAGVQVAQ